MKNLVLIGFMGSGKSTVGRICADRLGYDYVDSDADIEKRAGCSITQLFASQGEAAFRALERQALAELSARPDVVLATGGGAVLDAENVSTLRANSRIVLLTATPECILERVRDAVTRPLLADAADPLKRIRELLAQREVAYR